MKNYSCVIIGCLTAIATTLFGGWSGGLTTLVIFMAIDFTTGLILAGVFHSSNKSKNGRLESNAGWKGICRKFATLAIVALAYRLDLLIGTNYLRDAVMIAFCVNELISILENVGLMGVPIPQTLIDAIDVLKNKDKSK